MAIVVLGACGSDDPPSTASPGTILTSEATEAPDADPATDLAVRVQETVDLSPRIAGRLEPLAANELAPMSPESALKIAQSDPVAGRFFDDKSDLAAVQIQLGRFIADYAGPTLSSDLPGSYPEFIAYVMTGGADICISQAPAGAKAETYECFGLAVVDAEHNFVVWVSESDQKFLDSLSPST